MLYTRHELGHDVHRDHHVHQYQLDDLRGFRALRNISISIHDLGLTFSDDADVTPWAESLISLLPASSKCLVFQDKPALDASGPDPTRFLDLAVASMLEDGKFQNLKAVYLEEVEPIDSDDEPRSKEPRFSLSIAAGRRTGVGVHMLTNRSLGQHPIGLPGALDEYSLVATLGKEARPSDCEFNPYRGEWERPEL